MSSHKHLVKVISLVLIIILGVVFGYLTLQKRYSADSGNKDIIPKVGKPNNDTSYVLVKTTHQQSLQKSITDETLVEDSISSASLSSIGVKRYKVNGQSTAEEIADRMNAQLKKFDPESFVEPDTSYPPQLEPNDPWYFYGHQWYLDRIKAALAWDIHQGSSSIIVSVLDTGINQTHEDLVPNMIPGWNVYNNTSDTTDQHGHGTAVSGVASVATNNAIGVASVCWKCKLMMIKVVDNNGNTTNSVLASGLSRAADGGAKVANISFAAGQSSTVRTAAQLFESRGGVVTIAAGNDGLTQTLPDNPYVLNVSASNTTDDLYSWSNRGSDIDVASPGSVYTTANNGAYSGGAGTSFSAPTVASLAGLVYSINPSFTGQQVQNFIKQGADDLGTPGWDSLFGWGRLNAFRTAQLASGGTGGDTTAPTAPTNLRATAASNTTVNLEWSASTDNVGVTAYHIYRNNVLVRSVSGTTLTYSDTGLTPGTTYSYFVKAADAAGNNSAQSNTATATTPLGFTWSVLPYVSAKTTTSATISFTTTTASTAVVEFWPRNGAHQTVSSASATAHNVVLPNLNPGGKYQYFVRVTSADGTTLTSVTSSFNTPRR